MAKVHVTDIYPIINNVMGILSASADSLKVRLGKDKSFQASAYDKEKDLEVFIKFPDTVESDKTQYFSIEGSRLKKLMTKQKCLNLDVSNNTLKYSFGKTKGILEVLNAEKFIYPEVQAASAKLNNLIFTNLPHIKLNALYKDREMMLFAQYIAADNLMYLCCGDNFHVGLVTIENAKAGDIDFDITIPLKYVELAKKFSDDGQISIAISERNTFFFTPFVMIQLPLISSEGSKASLKAALDHYTYLNDQKDKVVFDLDINELKIFLDNALAIKEKDTGNDITLKIDDGLLLASIETTHGRISKSMSVKHKNTGELKLSCAALDDFTKKIEGTVQVSFIGDSVLIDRPLDKKVQSSVKYTAIGRD
jgi:hypothetical protein